MLTKAKSEPYRCDACGPYLKHAHWPPRLYIWKMKVQRGKDTVWIENIPVFDGWPFEMQLQYMQPALTALIVKDACNNCTHAHWADLTDFGLGTPWVALEDALNLVSS